LPTNFVVCDFIKRGMSYNVLRIASEETDTLTRKDIIVIWYGANYISKNNTLTGIMIILQFIKNSTHINIIMVNVPYRCHLSASSCVNIGVISFNRKLGKILNPFTMYP
jgi:hypothetical protein